MHKSDTPRRQWKLAPVPVVVFSAVLAACGFGTDLENLYGEPPSDSGPIGDAGLDALLADTSSKQDGSAPDAAEDALLDSGSTVDRGLDAAPDAFDSGPRVCSLPNLLTNGNFEQGVLAPWSSAGFNSSAISVNATSARTGSFGLSLARSGGDSSNRVYQPNLPIGSGYYARAYIKANVSTTTILLGLGDRTVNVPADNTRFRCAELTGVTTSAGNNSLTVINMWNDGGSYNLSVDDAVMFAIPVGAVPPECTCAALP
jgi:hypothetical protein